MRTSPLADPTSCDTARRVFLAMSQHPGFEATDLSSLRLLVCGGAPCPEGVRIHEVPIRVR